ncbi:hypothetical protein AOQ89_00495 [bacterium endosymbiont of Pedicinus badii]|nr:hypothetical protein AOQ89_00495 [bacterium endosymbiont of Pedicinus badii]
MYQDKEILAFNKPNNMSVHGGNFVKFGLIEKLKIFMKDTKFLELVHRLDKKTSGILLLAKKKSILKNLHEQFRNKTIKKEYFAIVHGNVVKNRIIKKEISEYRIKNKKKIKKKKFSKTQFLVKKKFKNATYVKIIPYTGRKHQIRIHSKYMGNPIIGDEKYGSKKLNKLFTKNGFKKLYLHSYSIKFVHPKTKKIKRIKAPINPSIKKLLYFLQEKKCKVFCK